MKKFSLFLMAMLFSVMSFADTYTHTFKSGELKVGTVTLSGVSWTGAGNVPYWGFDTSNGRGLQIGSKNSPSTAYSLTTSDFEGKITEVVVNASMASSGTAKLSISVGGTSYLSNKALTTSATNYTATGEASGDLVISFTNTAKAFYIKSISVTYVVEENPDAVKYTVTANVNDPAMGTVSGAGEIEEGKTATLTANANAGYKFVNWSNGSTDNPLKITVTENVEITANFEVIPTMTCAEAAAAPKDAVVVLNPFDVVYVVKGAGYIYIKDESGVNLIFDYTMDDQLKAGDHVEGFVGVSSPYNGLPELKPSVAFADLKVTPGTTHEATVFETVPTQEDVNKYVVFKGVKLTSNISYTTASATNATISVGGKNVTLRNAFKLAASLTSGSTYDIYAFVAVYNGSIQVYYASSVDVSPERTITATVNPAETGTVTGAGTYKEGKTATLTATPAEGYAFTCWTEGEDTVSTAANYSFKVAADRALVANFAKKTYNVTVTAENGTVEGAGEYIENAEVTLTATPAEGYEFVNWTVADSIVSTENPYTFNVTADVALVANFKAVVVEEPLPEGVPTNAELWEAFKPYYNTYYGLTRADQPIDKVSTFAAAKMQEIMTDAASEYKWLGDYVLGVAAGQGVNLPTDMAAANEGAWRWAVHAFFNATTGANGAAGTDFTEAGKPQVWGPYYLAAQKPAEGPVEIVGVVKRALQLGETTIILTHEANGTPHIYTVAGDAIAEVSQEGVVAKDTANAGDYLTISDIALTEDGKLVACNYVRNQFDASYVESGYKRGTLHLYVWHDIKGAASIWFESMFTGNSGRGDCGYTMAVNGTVANANILVTAVHNSHRGVRMSHYTVIDSAYVEPNYANKTFNNHLFYVGAKFKGASAGVDAATFNEATHGVNFQLNASPLAENNWVMDSEGLMPTEFGVAAQEDPSIVGAVAETLVSKALVGAYYVTVGDKKVMVAPYADAEGKLAGVKLLDITAGFANATLLTTAESLDLTAPVAATGVATTAVVESNGTLTINLIADATIHTMTATIQESPSTNLEDNNVQNDIIKFYQNGQIYIMINGAVYNVMGQMVK